MGVIPDVERAYAVLHRFQHFPFVITAPSLSALPLSFQSAGETAGCVCPDPLFLASSESFHSGGNQVGLKTRCFTTVPSSPFQADSFVDFFPESNQVRETFAQRSGLSGIANCVKVPSGFTVPHFSPPFSVPFFSLPLS